MRPFRLTARRCDYGFPRARMQERNLAQRSTFNSRRTRGTNRCARAGDRRETTLADFLQSVGSGHGNALPDALRRWLRCITSMSILRVAEPKSIRAWLEAPWSAKMSWVSKRGTQRNPCGTARTFAWHRERISRLLISDRTSCLLPRRFELWATHSMLRAGPPITCWLQRHGYFVEFNRAVPLAALVSGMHSAEPRGFTQNDAKLSWTPSADGEAPETARRVTGSRQIGHRSTRALPPSAQNYGKFPRAGTHDLRTGTLGTRPARESVGHAWEDVLHAVESLSGCADTGLF